MHMVISRRQSFPAGSVIKRPSAKEGDVGLILGSGRSPGEGSGSQKYSCLENPMDREAWQATVQGVAKELDTEQLRVHAQILYSQYCFLQMIMYRQLHYRECERKFLHNNFFLCNPIFCKGKMLSKIPQTRSSLVSPTV